LIKVLVADDEALLRSAFSSLIRAQDDLEVVGEAASGQQAVELAAGRLARRVREMSEHLDHTV
jgi:DNA-binding NarL/FixJ family response regulator